MSTKVADLEKQLNDLLKREKARDVKKVEQKPQAKAQHPPQPVKKEAVKPKAEAPKVEKSKVQVLKLKKPDAPKQEAPKPEAAKVQAKAQAPKI